MPSKIKNNSRILEAVHEGASDLQREQQYFRERLKLHNRCAHGFGVACWLEERAASSAG